MKKLTLLIFVLFSYFILEAQQNQIFVNLNATGANDGSSWEDAYTDFQTALDDNTKGIIWVARGTYRPGSGSLDRFATFRVNRPVSIFGGFAGDETTQNGRDISANPTVLSADLAGDDIIGNNQDNKSDNALHVMTVSGGLSFVLLDAFVVSGGTSLSETNQPSSSFIEQTGAGVFSESRMVVTNCQFTENIGGKGVALALIQTGASNSVVQNCQFYKNTILDRGALLLDRIQNTEVKDCEFFDNAANEGALHTRWSAGLNIENCNFNNNVNAMSEGGGIYNWHSTRLDVVNCDFIGNFAASGGGIYSELSEFPTSLQFSEDFLIKDCLFESNLATQGSGGAVRSFTSSFEVLNSTFTNNNANGFGGAVASDGGGKIVILTDCNFNENVAGSGQGGGLAVFGDSTSAIINRTDFVRNNSINNGGGAAIGNMAAITFENCHFEENTSRFGGGLYSSDDFTSVTLKETTFENNSAVENGGAISIDGGQELVIENSAFDNNTSGNIGGALSISEGQIDLARMNLSNTRFLGNTAANRAGALNINNANSNITSCLFAKNTANGSGIGGAMAISASGFDELTITIKNSTLADNVGAVAGGIATNTADGTFASMFLQNNALFNSTANYGAEVGSMLLVSSGGNFSNDDSAIDFFKNGSDINDTQMNPLFLNADNNDYRLTENSPLVDTGIDNDAPATDLNGDERLGQVDVGAFEFQGEVSSTKTIQEDAGNIQLTPNPVDNRTVMTLENDWFGEFELKIVGVTGQVLSIQQFSKNDSSQQFEINVKSLTAGQFYLILNNGKQVISKRLVKL